MKIKAGKTTVTTFGTEVPLSSEKLEVKWLRIDAETNPIWIGDGDITTITYVKDENGDDTSDIESASFTGVRLEVGEHLEINAADMGGLLDLNTVYVDCHSKGAEKVTSASWIAVIE